MANSIAPNNIAMATRVSVAMLGADIVTCRGLMRAIEAHVKAQIEGIVCNGGLPWEFEAVCKALDLDYTALVQAATLKLSAKPHENYEEGHS